MSVFRNKQRVYYDSTDYKSQRGQQVDDPRALSNSCRQFHASSTLIAAQVKGNPARSCRMCCTVSQSKNNREFFYK